MIAADPENCRECHLHCGDVGRGEEKGAASQHEIATRQQDTAGG
jgi:hypothetical protein